MPATAEATNLFLPEDLEDVSKTAKLAEGELHALQAVADWIKTFVAKPHQDLGRTGPVCPFVPGSLQRETLWLAPVQIADRSVPDALDLISGYQRLFLDARPADGDDAIYKSFVVVFTTCRRIARRSSLTTCWSSLRFPRMSRMDS